MSVLASTLGSATETRERLRRLIRALESRPSPREMARRRGDDAAPPHALPAGIHAPLEGAQRRVTASGTLTYREQRFDLHTFPVGAQPLHALVHADIAELSLLSPDLGGEDPADLAARLLFLDIETTGLGGAGAMIFLVAIAHLEDGALRMRQYLAESPAEEGALLDALLADIHASIADPVLVTYNGRTFDAPMLDGRATMHRRRSGFESLPHLDVLGPARALYRGWLPSCRLAEVESRILGVTRPSADVDGAEVPAWYFRFLRSGDMRFVAPIASHNLLDVLSLAALTARLVSLVRGSEPPRGAEAIGLGRLLARREPARAIATLEAAEAADTPMRHDLLWLLAQLLKRHGPIERAVPLWQEIADVRGAWSMRALEELAKFYEHHAKDFARAAHHVDRALAGLEVGDRVAAGARADERRRVAFRHRRQRLTLRLDRTNCGA